MFLYAWFFIFGAIIGSFFNVCIDRLPYEQNIIKGRSFCFECFHQLRWNDLIPIFSYLCLKGRCRYCHQRISIRYPIFEAIGGSLMVFLAYMYHERYDYAVFLFFLLMTLLTITLIDHQYLLIPHELIIICAILALCSLPYFSLSFLERVIGMGIVSLPLIMMNFVIKESFGGGDIKLMFVCGFLLGAVQIVLAFMIAVILGGSYAAYLLLKKRDYRQTHIAFGGFLCLGIVISLFYGEQILCFLQRYLFLS